MKQPSSKISFNVQRPVTETVADPQAEPVHKVQATSLAEEASDHLPLPPVFSAPQREPEHETAAPDAPHLPEQEPEWHTATEPKPFLRPAPKPPGFAATGLMAQQQVGFIRRNAVALGVGGGAALVLALGLISAFMPVDDQEPRQFSQSAEAALRDIQETPTRSVAADLTDVSAVTDLDAQTGSSAKDALAKAVLAGLTPAPQPAQPAPQVAARTLLNSIKLRQLREGVLAGLYSVVVVEDNGAQRVELGTHNVKMTAGYQEDLLIEAAHNGLLELSSALRTSTGRLDTKTMIFDVVQRSLFADNTPASTEAALDMSRRVFAASVARTQFVQGQRVYTVQPGDSLAYIALQFFGMPGEYERILDANPDTLQSPDKIQTGQRLIIPS